MRKGDAGMKTVELFCGTKSFSKVAERRGLDTYTVDIDDAFSPDCVADLLRPFPEELSAKISDADIIWMSPPCTTFSMAAGNTHWSAGREPKTQAAREARKLLQLCEDIAEMCIAENKLFFIENPVARARWFLPLAWRKTVWYCRYGDHRAKPTDIWSNLDRWRPKACKNGNPLCDHERAPRGSKTGTQGLKGATARGEIPPALFHEIFDAIEQPSP